MSRMASLFGLLLCLAVQTAQAGPLEYYRLKYLRQKYPVDQSFLDKSREEVFQQRLDHSKPGDPRTFEQRFWINSTFASGPAAPVVYVICGEGTCSAESSFWGAAVEYASHFKAHLVALEHRYYGMSQPFPRLTAESMRYLTTANALADLASFQDYAASTQRLSGKWVVIGGSYAGSLAAYYRLKYPQKVVGALASSAPVEARTAFIEYDAHVTDTVGPECAKRMRKVVREIEAAMDNSLRLNEIKAVFESTEIRDPLDFLYVVADMGAAAVQYGYDQYFCESIKDGNELETYAKAGIAILRVFGSTPIDSSYQKAESEDPSDYMGFFGMRQWLYQTCTEYGYYQVAHPDPELSTRSSRIDLAVHHGACKRLFGIDLEVNTTKTNQDFYKPMLNSNGPTRIYFTNGSADPWSNLSITAERGNQSNPALTSFMIEGASHCEDLGAGTTPELLEARQKFKDLLAVWLN